MPLTKMPMTAPPISSASGPVSCENTITMIAAPAWNVRNAGPAAHQIGEEAEHENAETHAEDGDGDPQRRLQRVVAKAARQIARQPDHQAVVAEVLHPAEDQHGEADFRRLGVL